MTEKFEKKYDCGILNFWSSNNYGALLTCYALQESVKELGLVPGIINYHCRWEKFEGLLSDRFSRKYLDLTEPCADFEDLRRLNRQTQTFIAGSDQIWRYKYFWPRGKNIYQLSFASLNARKIAYAASFGLDRWEGGYENTLRTKYYMSRFDGISVREDDGVFSCEEAEGRAELLHDIDYARVNRILAGERERSLKWLKNALTAPVRERSPEEMRLFETAEMLQRQINELTRDKQILYEALYLPKLKRKLRKYKLKTLFSFGKKHEKYKKAKRELKNKIRFIRRVVKQNQQY